MKNNIGIVPVKNDIVLLQKEVIKEITDLSDSISRGEDELKNKLDELEVSNIDICIKRHWYGSINKNSIEESIQKVYSNLGEYFVTCGDAIRNTNNNLARTLDLIKLLAIVEQDLYKQIDDQAVSSNELKNILLDWFKQQGIKDDDVKELIETSFQRAYTLRDRINVLRHECNTKISQALERIGVFEEKFDNVDSEIKNLLNKAIKELNDRIAKERETLEILCKDKVSILESEMHKIKRIIDDSKNEFEARKKFLQRIWWLAILSCISISGIVSYVIVTLCK